MGHSEIDDKTLFRWKILCLFTCWGVFFISYFLAGSYAASLEEVPSFHFTFEKYIPFLPATIYPYMSSGVFFVYVFFLCSTCGELSVLSKRVIFVTLIAGICFVLFPLKQNFSRPETANVLFTFLDRYDTPFNQAPSLHISYIFIYWSAVGSSRYKLWLRGWLCLMAVSTLTLYQHHVMDVISALALGYVASLLFPYRKERNKQIAKVYLLASTLVLSAALFAAQYTAIGCIALLWCVATLALIARAYYKSDSEFLKNKRGAISACKYILYLPYIVTYWILWLFSTKAVREIAPRVYIGGRLSSRKAKSFSQLSEVTVFDVSSELPENAYFRKTAVYHCLPLLDIGAVAEQRSREIVTAVLSALEKADDTGKIYIHCTMGCFRSHLIGKLLLHEMKNNIKHT